MNAVGRGPLENTGGSKDPLDVLVHVAMCPLVSGNTVGLLVCEPTVLLALGTPDPVAEWIGG